MDRAYVHRLLNAICAGRIVHSKSVRAIVTRAVTTIVKLEKLAALVKVSGCALNHYSGDQLPMVCNGGYSPREQIPPSSLSISGHVWCNCGPAEGLHWDPHCWVLHASGQPPGEEAVPGPMEVRTGVSPGGL